ncbi:XdhC/CoxI family protein [Streptomyces sp. NBC_00038]|uniref:XdhC family protein n=1 Tax=Streptomyces sp. NBC_00038 TaxID=2903615 RepID=UPI002258C1E4|nr:XdhC/CoxI family protein [Streptomyces sp. NBC_00038]MCX5554788.1 XdhC family protein [Streptomyces sp. NBC_00038]
MRDILETLDGWCATGTRFAVASVIGTWSSSPKQPGAAMAVSENGEVVGSVSGGCVEAAVYELARQALETGEAVTETFGVADDDAFAVGLTCGGTLEIFVRPVADAQFAQWSALAAAVREGRRAAMATALSGASAGACLLVRDDGGVTGSLGERDLDVQALARMRRHDPLREPCLGSGWAESADGPSESWRGTSAGAEAADRRAMSTDGLEARDFSATTPLDNGVTRERLPDGTRLFLESFTEPPRLLIFGAIDYAGALARLGAFLGYRVTVCDARPVFATAARFPDAHEIVVDWPHRWLSGTRVDERTAICVLTHDPKFDIPLLEVALQTEAAYIGAMGSRRTHEDRLRRLRDAGVDDRALARLRSPIGLDLGGRTPEETAVSIAAEVIALREGGTGRSLTETLAPIHALRASASFMAQ